VTTGPLTTPPGNPATGAGNVSGIMASPAAGASDNGRLATLPTFGGAAGLTVASGAGLSSTGSEPGANPLAPFYNAIVLSQVLAPPNPAGGGGGGGGTSTGSKTTTATPATPSTTTEPQGPTTGTAGGASLLRMENVVLDATTGVPANPKLNGGEVSPPPLDIQNAITALPAVQAGDPLRQDSAAVDRGGIADGPAVTLATPEPSPAVLLAVAIAVYLGAGALRRPRCRNGGGA
jgi:hypothetical protein